MVSKFSPDVRTTSLATQNNGSAHTHALMFRGIACKQSSIPELGRSPEEEKGYPLQYSGLEKSMDCMAHGVAKSLTQLSNFHKEIKPVSPKGNQP